LGLVSSPTQVGEGLFFVIYFIRLSFELFEGDFYSCTSSPPRLDNFGYQAPGFFVQKQNSLFKMPKTQPDEVYDKNS
jgi:hypothetical protein